MAGRLAGLYGYEIYTTTGDSGAVWSVARRAPFRHGCEGDPTGMPSAEEWQQARTDYARQQRQRLDRLADRLFDTHPDLVDLTGHDGEHDPDDI